MKKNLALITLSLGICVLIVIAAVFRKAEVSANDKIPSQSPPVLARLSEQVSIHAANRGTPWINFKDGHDLLTEVAADSPSAQAFQQNDLSPLALTSADVDEDGVPDLIASYGGAHGGMIAVYRGNVDAIYPNAPAARQRKAQGTFTDAPFLSPARLFDAPLSPDFIGAGDFDADGHLDVVMTARGSRALYLLKGDGKGNLLAPRAIALDGAVTAMATGEINRRDGLTDVIVGIISASGPQAVVLESAEGAMKATPEVFALREAATDFALGALDDDYPIDLAIAAGHDLVTVYGRDKTSALGGSQGAQARPVVVSRQRLPFALRSIAIGGFTVGHHADIAVLGDDGKLYALSTNQKPARTSQSISARKPWKIHELTSEAWPASTRLLKAKVSSLPSDDLILIDSVNHQLHVIATSSDASSRIGSSSSASRIAPVTFDVDDEPVAVLPMRLNIDALNDLMVLRKHNLAPAAVTTQSAMTFTVIDSNDDGKGSLRQAIMDANTNPGADTIIFMDGSGAQTIDLLSPLPTITEAVTIDGTSQPEFVGDPLIELNGNSVPPGGSGLKITSGNCTVRALVINRFIDNGGAGGVGIFIQTGGNNLLEGNFIGTDMGGNAALGNGVGVAINASPGNIVGGMASSSRNLISGNTDTGVVIGNTATGNQIQGNFIGTNVTGTMDLGNRSEGVLFDGVMNNTVGGTTAAARNVISGNDEQGILARAGATGNLVQGNFIGTNAAGTAAIGNSGDGISVEDSPNNTFGGTAAGARNIISGNEVNGISIIGSGATGNQAQGNFIGTNVAGTAALGNSQSGVNINGASNNTIGGTAAGARNIISGNTTAGVFIIGSSSTSHPTQGNFIGSPATGNQIQGNFIGTDVSGNSALANSGNGVTVQDGTTNTIGGTAAGAGNLLSGNGSSGLRIDSGSNNTVQGNFVGTNAAGTAAIGNAANGVAIVVSTNNTIGGATTAARNLISGNGVNGVGLNAADGNTIQGNFIGINVTGNMALANAGSGITVTDSSNVNVVGNVISGNGDDGVELEDDEPGGQNNTVRGNFIGTNAAGTAAIPNGDDGVEIGFMPNNIIGGTTAADRNIISGNGVNGISITGSGATGNQAQGNFIGTDINGTMDLGNSGNGVLINDALNNIIGGTAAGARNIISGNDVNGISISGNGTAAGNQVQGNFIGTNASGNAAIGNTSAGIELQNASSNTIGGTTANARNVISGNNSDGVRLSMNAMSDLVQGNFIGVASNGTSALANNGNGVFVGTGTGNHTIGGTSAGAGNTIAFNSLNGVSITGASVNNGILVNAIFSNGSLGINLSDDLVTPNDLGDPDTGPNNLQNFPVLTSATSGSSTNIKGTLNSTPSSTYRLEFFSNPTCDPLGNGEGQTFLGTTNVTTDGAGNTNIDVTFPGSVAAGQVVTATATDAANNTSEFSSCILVMGSPCSITCPANITKPNDPNKCGAITIYPPPDISGSCGSVTCIPSSGSFFSVGTTIVTCTTIGGPACSFTVTINDTQPPLVICPQNISTTVQGQTSKVVTYGQAAILDNCAGSNTLNCTPPSSAAFPVGTTTVNCIATDGAGNAASCAFTITVIDVFVPPGNCPPNLGVVAGAQCAATVSYPLPNISTSPEGTTVACTPPPGTSFPVGTTPVNCVITTPSGNRTTCSFAITVTPSTSLVQVAIPGGKTFIEFGTPTPITARRKPLDPGGLACSPFTITNAGCGAVTLTLSGIQRIGSDVVTGRITNPDDDGLFTVSVVNSDGSETPLSTGATVQFARDQQKRFCARFNPTIPATAGKTTGLAADQVLPDTVTSRIAFTILNGLAVNVDLVGHVATAAQLINPNKPRKNPVIGFKRNGNEFTATFSVHDANLDVTRAHYEFLDGSGQVVGDAIDVDLAAPVRSANLVKGQSFTIDQRFTGANSNPTVTGVRITVFDGETSVVGSASVVRSSSARRTISAASSGRPMPLAPRVKVDRESPLTEGSRQSFLLNQTQRGV